MFGLFKFRQTTLEIQNRSDIQTSQLIQKLREKFPVEISGIKDGELDTYFPAPQTTTTRRFPTHAEAGDELQWLSTNELITSNLQNETMTFRERLEFERMWFEKTNSHPDRKKTATLCSGSPTPPYNHTLYVCWKDRRLLIQLVCGNSKEKYLRARKVVPESRS